MSPVQFGRNFAKIGFKGVMRRTEEGFARGYWVACDWRHNSAMLARAHYSKEREIKIIEPDSPDIDQDIPEFPN